MSQSSSDASPATAPQRGPSSQESGFFYGWSLALALLGLSVLVTFGFYWHSVSSAVALWYGNSAYNHGFLILPISGYLIWDNKDRLKAMAPHPSLIGVGVVFFFSLAWLIARTAGINEGEHFAVVGILQGLVLAVLGGRLFKAMLLPMTYLWLMVPTGSFFQPILQGIAQWISAVMLKLSGVPVFTEGFYIEVPTGTYEIAPGCSGLNFILAGLALSPLFGYMMYSSLKKRLIAIAAMLAIAVIANGIRIYGIIALAEFTDRKIDIVDDHLLYGWGFFAIILLALGWIGSKFADPVDEMEKPALATSPQLASSVLLRGGLIALVVVSLLPLYRLYSVSRVVESSSAAIHLEATGALVSASTARWEPHFDEADAQLVRTIEVDGVRAEVFAALYDYQSDGRELITFSNDPTDNENYRRRGSYSRTLTVEGKPTPWRFSLIRSGYDTRLVAYSYFIDGKFVVSNLKAKLYQSKAALLWGRQDAGVIALSVPSGDNPEEAEAELRHLISELQLGQLFQPADE